MVYQYIIKLRFEVAFKTVYEHQEVEHNRILVTERSNFTTIV